jgi:HEAT repeat protein
MEKLQYEPIPHMSRDEIESAIARDDSEQLVCAALSAALYDEDPHWAENVCARLATHPNANVRANAIEGLGHIARIHRTLNPCVKPLIERAACDEDPWVRAKAHDATDDVTHFLKWDFAVQYDASN